MNNIDSNKYLAGRVKPLKEFTLRSYLHGEPIVPQFSDDPADIMRLNYAMLCYLGFKEQYPGTTYLASLVTRYILTTDFDLDIAVKTIAKAYGTTGKHVLVNILGELKENTRFAEHAEKLLDISFDREHVFDVKDTMEILGACFKLYYNYISDREDLFIDRYPLPNYSNFGICYGKSGKKD